MLQKLLNKAHSEATFIVYMACLFKFESEIYFTQISNFKYPKPAKPSLLNRDLAISGLQNGFILK